MMRLGLVFLAITLISGALGSFGLAASGITWIIFILFLVLTLVVLSILFDGLWIRSPMD
jgi:uncharacterized membrane protein YtjA (UPF0391 family)